MPGILANGALPRILFVLGKGGVGRSTVAAALGLARAARGERVLILEWALADTIGPWFGVPPAGPAPVAIAPRLCACNFTLDEALRAYFVDHLHAGLIYRHVIKARSVARMLEVAPGLAEMFFLGQLWWLTNLAEREAGLAFDRLIVDAPATGHGASLLDVPETLAVMGAAGLLAVETGRVTAMMADPAQVGAVVIALPEPLVVDETLELVPRVTARLGRPPLAVLINRSAAAIASAAARPAWLDELTAQLTPPAASALAELHAELRARVEIEAALRDRLAGAAGAISGIADLPGRGPRQVVEAIAAALGGAA